MASIGKTIKKLSKMGNGAGILLNKEISMLHWKHGDFVSVEAFDDGRILIKKVEY
jgi:antitoxin component of MazEF toxin-antitoxin module